MASPDCVGHLMKLGHRAKEWQRRLCLLKDACLYFYVDINVSSALGIIFFLSLNPPYNMTPTAAAPFSLSFTSKSSLFFSFVKIPPPTSLDLWLDLNLFFLSSRVVCSASIISLIIMIKTCMYVMQERCTCTVTAFRPQARRPQAVSDANSPSNSYRRSRACAISIFTLTRRTIANGTSSSSFPYLILKRKKS